MVWRETFLWGMEWKRVPPGGMEVEIAKADDSLPSFECDCEEKVEKGMATHSSILAWRIPWTEEPGENYSPQGPEESDTTEQLTCRRRKSTKGSTKKKLC